MAHLSPEQNTRLRKAMETAIAEKFRTRLALAEAMGVRPPLVSDFLNHPNVGASLQTAEAFAQRVAKRPLEEVIGVRKLGPVAPKPEGGGHPVDAETKRKAYVLLKQPPQALSDEAIAIAEECTVFRTAADAKNPAAVAEAWRLAILGTAASLPRSPSTAPTGTRPKKKWGR